MLFMKYDEFQKRMEQEKHGDGISVGAGLTGELTLYGSLVMCFILLFRLYSDVLFAFMGVSIIGLGLSVMPLLFKFSKENSNSINMQMFWISIFAGLLSVIIFFAR